MQVQLQAADVTKLGCDFVKEVINISKKYRTSISPLDCDLFEAFASYVKASTLSDYLSPNDVHCLKQKADSITTTVVPQTLTCNDQVSINIKAATKVCKQISVFADPYPLARLVENSVHPASEITLTSTSTCWTTVQTDTIQGGCTETICDDVYGGRLDLIKNYSLPSYPSIQDSVIAAIKLYETDSNGNYYTSHIVNLDPATSPYYGGVINPNDVKLGSPNFSTAFKALLNRFALTRPGMSSVPHLIDPRVFGNTLQFTITAKHKAKRLLGIDKSDAYLVLKTPSHGYVELPDPGTGYVTYPTNFYGKEFVPSPCGTYNPLVKAQTSRINFNTAASNFNVLSLASSRMLDPIVLSNSTRDCNIVELFASYSTIGTMLSRQWNTSFNTNIYLSDNMLADRVGTYYFTVDLENGCSVVKTYQVTSLPANTLTSDDELTA